MRYRVGIVTSKGRIEALNFDTREQVDDFILSFQGEEQLTHYRIKDETGRVIETEKGVNSD